MVNENEKRVRKLLKLHGFKTKNELILFYAYDWGGEARDIVVEESV